MFKHIFAFCCVLTLGFTSLHAQQAAGTARGVTVSKADFSGKVSELHKLLNKGKKDEAEAVFTDINKMANTELGISRDNMRKAQNEADKKRLAGIATGQRAIFAEALKLKQQDLSANKKQIVEKLKEFADTIE